MGTQKKFVILDFGNVIAGPKTGNWNIIPTFYDYIDKTKIDEQKLNKVFEKYLYILYLPVRNRREEFEMMSYYYKKVLLLYGYPITDDEAAKIAYDRVVERNNYMYYANVKEELEKLAKKYTLLLLSDNWPSVVDEMKDKKIYECFKKVYVSSLYGVVKDQKLFFEHPINDFNIKNGQAIYIDDMEHLLNIGREKGLDTMIMDRDNKVRVSSHQIIHNFECLL